MNRRTAEFSSYLPQTHAFSVIGCVSANLVSRKLSICVTFHCQTKMSLTKQRKGKGLCGIKRSDLNVVK